MPRPKKQQPVTYTFEEIEEARQAMIEATKASAAALIDQGQKMTRWVEMQPGQMSAALAGDLKRGADGEVEVDGTGKKKKRSKKEKDPNAPKRPMSAYLAYQNQNREKYKAANPGINNQALLYLISEKWNALGEAGQKSYKDQANKEMKEWREATGEFNEGKTNNDNNNNNNDEEEEEEEEEGGSRGGLLSRFAEAANVLLGQVASTSSASTAAPAAAAPPAHTTAAAPAAATAANDDDSDSSASSSSSSSDEEEEEKEPTPVPVSKKSKSSKTASAAPKEKAAKKSKK